MSQHNRSILALRILLTRFAFATLVTLAISGCYHHKPVVLIPKTKQRPYKTVFIGLDGVDFALMDEVKRAGHFKNFAYPVPVTSTFLSATTIGFTGLFAPLGVGRVPGYEVRFFSIDDNRIRGGTPQDIYRIPINYKRYFDWFRSTIQQKGVMYGFPSMASRQDLSHTQSLALTSDKQVIFSYLGGTDGSAHMLGRNRTKRTLIDMSRYLERVQKRYIEKYNSELRFVLFSDHGFEYTPPKSVSQGELKKKLEDHGHHMKTKIVSDDDIVFVEFGLLNGGAAYANRPKRASMAGSIARVKGLDVVFWHDDNNHVIHIINQNGETADFEYRGIKSYRYVPKNGDPLDYLDQMRQHNLHASHWHTDAQWKQAMYNHTYPDVGFRVYDAFFNLVENPAAILFSLKPGYQFGSLPARIGTWARLGQRGTHGGLFKQASWAFAMSDLDTWKDLKSHPTHLRYNEVMPLFLPDSVKDIQKFEKANPQSSWFEAWDAHNQHEHENVATDDPQSEFKQSLADLEHALMAE